MQITESYLAKHGHTSLRVLNWSWAAFPDVWQIGIMESVCHDRILMVNDSMRSRGHLSRSPNWTPLRCVSSLSVSISSLFMFAQRELKPKKADELISEMEACFAARCTMDPHAIGSLRREGDHSGSAGSGFIFSCGFSVFVWKVISCVCYEESADLWHCGIFSTNALLMKTVSPTDNVKGQNDNNDDGNFDDIDDVLTGDDIWFFGLCKPRPEIQEGEAVALGHCCICVLFKTAASGNSDPFRPNPM